MKTLLKVLAVSACSVLLSGCQEFSGQLALTSSPSGPPLYTQDQPMTLVKPFEFRIVKCYWTDEIERPGYDKLPPAFRERQRDAYVLKPHNRFLVVEMSEKNLANTPMGWHPLNVPILLIKNAKGATYTTTSGVAMNEIVQVVTGQHHIVNPDEIVAATEVFDVPQDDYLLEFSLGNYDGAGSYEANRLLCKWSLVPEGKK